MTESINRLSERLRAAIRTGVLASPGSARILVACSGGADSVCLVHATARVAQEAGRSLAVAHVRHGLRPDDAADLARVASFAGSLGLPFLSKTLAFSEQNAPNGNVEARLRAARYDALARMATAAGAMIVLTGHTLDDQAETILLRLLRGTGLDGLGGIEPEGPMPTPFASPWLRLLRPLLAFRRAETRAYCAAHALPFADDPTNDDTRFTRNWLRHAIIPALEARYPAVAPTLARTAALLREDATVLEAQAQEALRRCLLPFVDAVTALDMTAYAAVEAPVRRRMLRAILLERGVPVRADRLRDLDTALTRPGGGERRIGALRCVAARGTILIGADGPIAECLQRET